MLNETTTNPYFLWVSVNLIYDILKAIFLIIIWYVWCKYVNYLKIKWNSNKIKQVWKWNYSKISWNKNEVDQNSL